MVIFSGPQKDRFDPNISKIQTCFFLSAIDSVDGGSTNRGTPIYTNPQMIFLAHSSQLFVAFRNPVWGPITVQTREFPGLSSRVPCLLSQGCSFKWVEEVWWTHFRRWVVATRLSGTATRIGSELLGGYQTFGTPPLRAIQIHANPGVTLKWYPSVAGWSATPLN